MIERDDGEGDPARACASGQTVPPCFHDPARFKRVCLVDLANPAADGALREIGYMEPMAIRDPNKTSRGNGHADVLFGATFEFPFFTIENVARVNAEHIIVANDNNLPFSAGRHPGKADDDEFILLRLPQLLNAR